MDGLETAVETGVMDTHIVQYDYGPRRFVPRHVVTQVNEQKHMFLLWLDVSNTALFPGKSQDT